MKNKAPKSSPSNAIDASSSPNESIVTSNRSNPATPEILAVQPKLENSPPSNRPYDQIMHSRQTVLMWGSGNQQPNEMSPANASPNTRSPCETPKSNHSLSLFNNQAAVHAQQSHGLEKCSKPMDSQHVGSHHIKWNGNSGPNASKEVISIFPIHHGNEVYSQTASANAHDSHHPNHHIHRHSSDITSCEVWPSAYPQYQYFSYAHHQHQASTQ